MDRKILLTGGLLLLFALILSVGQVAGQAVYGSIFGTVTDQTGAAIPGAEVTITDVGKGTKFVVMTNQDGNYVKERLIPGRYQVSVSASGFKTAVVEVEVMADVAARTDVVLEPGEITEEITVTAEAPLLKTDRADVSTSFDREEIIDLPIVDRNFTQFQLLTPGTQKLAVFQHASSENPQGSIQIQVNGQHFSGTYFELDGTDNRDPILGIIVINPPLESISEMKITTQDYDAEFGVATGAVITAQTKSGTNEVHGSAFWFRRNDEQSARNPFTQTVPIGGDPNKLIPDTLFNQFGGSLGGPIMKNKWFIFGDYQGTRRKNGGSVLTTVPTEAARRGDFSEFGIPIFDPLTGNPDGTGRRQFEFNGKKNVIPPDRLSPQALALIRQLPLPNLPGLDRNFSASGIEAFDDDAFDIRSDAYLTENFHLFGRYSLQDFRRQLPGAFGDLLGGPNLDVSRFAGRSDVRNQSLATGFDYVLGPSVVTDFRFGWFRYRVNVLPGGVGTSPAADAGIPGLNVDDFFTSGMPAFFVNGTGGFQIGFALGINGCNCPLKESEEQVQFVNNWSITRGNHSTKFGVDFRRAYNLRVPSDRHRAGELTFNPERTADIGGVGGGLGVATFLIGDVSSFTRFVSPSFDAAERQNRLFFYGQDKWRMTPKLTFNYGVRWEIIFPETVNGDGNGGWLDLNTGEIRVAGIGDIGRDGNVETDLGAWAPRLGLAYQLNERTVLRIGYGRSFDIGTFGSIFGHFATQNLPVLSAQDLAPANNFDRVFNLADGPPPPVFPEVPANGRIPLPDGIFARARPDRVRLATVDAWNVTIQHQLSENWSVEIAYVGNKGTHVFSGFDGSTPTVPINQPTIEGFGVLSTNERKPFFRKFGWTQGIDFFCNCHDNNYNSLQLKVIRRFAQGFSLNANYTYGKVLNHDATQILFNDKLGYGPPTFDRTHTLIVSSLWELPFGRGKRWGTGWSRALDLVLGGWQINQTTTASSGRPFTPSYRDCGQDQDVGLCRPSLVGDPTPSDQNRNQWFIPASQVLTQNGQVSGPWQRPQPGTFGTIGRGALRGPQFFQTDMAFFKNIQITERIKAQFRAEAFNVFNVVNLGIPESCIDCNLALAGKITSTEPFTIQRQWRWAIRLEF